jgi:hypothetical protein
MATKTRARANGHVSGTIGNGRVGSEEPFTYTTADGKEITVASLAKPFGTAGELRKLRGASPIDLAYYIIERDCDPETLAIVDAMSMEEFNDQFSRQWAHHSGIDLGE